MRVSCCEARRGLALLTACGALLLAACGPLSLSEEAQLGNQFEQSMRQQLPLLHDRVVTDYVREMGQGLVRAAGTQPFDYHFYVVVDDEINAFAGPAGHVYVNTGTILRARNASELAGVIAHEVGHVAERHIAENYNRQRNTQIGQQVLVLGAAVAGGGAIANMASLGTGLAAATYLNTFGREAEKEADLFAVAVMPRAGWDPNGLVTFFKVLQAEGGSSGVPTFLSSHPATEDRIESTSAAITALPPDRSLRSNDGGKLEIIQRRILLLTRQQRR